MEYKDVNDYEVIYMIRENNDDYREMMLKKYIPIINKLAAKYFDFAKKCGCEFDDLVQEGLIALNRSINSYNENEKVLFFTYATVCIERHLITYCRSISCNRYVILNESVNDDLLFYVKDENDYFQKIINNGTEMDKFIEYKNLFNFEQSSVFELRYNGFSYKEISCLLDIPISTVDGRLCKIRSILQEKKKNFC